MEEAFSTNEYLTKFYYYSEENAKEYLLKFGKNELSLNAFNEFKKEALDSLIYAEKVRATRKNHKNPNFVKEFGKHYDGGVIPNNYTELREYSCIKLFFDYFNLDISEMDRLIDSHISHLKAEGKLLLKGR